MLLRYRFDEVLKTIHTPGHWLSRITPQVKASAPLWERVRRAAEELGPTFVKAAQLLSTRPDILPRELIDELKQLRDDVSPLPWEQIQPRLEYLLGGKIEDVFQVFQSTPIASGSIGQIYKAQLRDSGEWVCVKVQRPDIRKKVEIDLEIIAWFAHQMHQHLTKLRPFDLPTVVDELRLGILKELDFAVEAHNATLFNALNQSPSKVFAPKVHHEHTNEFLLVTEWIDGRAPDRLEVEPEERATLARTGGESFFDQIVVTGFFHGDPHAGNIFITADGRLCFLDWGLAGQLTRQMRYHLIDLFSACQDGDAERVARIAVRMGRSTRRINHSVLEKGITAALFKNSENLLRMQNLGRLIFELIFVFGSNGIHIARDYTLLARAVISIEETAKQLDPDFNLAEVGKPFIRRITMERWNPLKWGKQFATEARERLSLIADLPNDLQRLIHRFEDEDIGVQLKHTGLDKASDTIHAAFSRLSLAVIIGALIIGSSIVITTGVQPLLWGYPAIGIVGYLLSGLMGLRVAWDIIRSGSRSRH